MRKKVVISKNKVFSILKLKSREASLFSSGEEIEIHVTLWWRPVSTKKNDFFHSLRASYRCKFDYSAGREKLRFLWPATYGEAKRGSVNSPFAISHVPFSPVLCNNDPPLGDKRGDMTEFDTHGQRRAKSGTRRLAGNEGPREREKKGALSIHDTEKICPRRPGARAATPKARRD